MTRGLALTIAIALIATNMAFGASGFGDRPGGPGVAPGHDLYVFDEAGSVLARPGVSWPELEAAGVHPSQMHGAQQVILDGVQGWAYPEVAAPPEWLTPDVSELLMDGRTVVVDVLGGDPLVMDAKGSDIGDVPRPFSGIRPGMGLASGFLPSYFCTGNFIFKDATDWYIGTAGHCVSLGREVWGFVVHDNGALVQAFPLGVVVFTTGSQGIGTDFALIRIHAGNHDRIDPRVTVIDGPCGLRDTIGGLNRLQYYGHSPTGGAGGQARTGNVVSSGSDSLMYTRLPIGGGGDSGSPVRFGWLGVDDDLAAAAIHTHGLVSPSAVGYGTKIARALDLADTGGFPVELVSGSACPGGWPSA